MASYVTKAKGVTVNPEQLYVITKEVEWGTISI